jgi:hypothetical protein
MIGAGAMRARGNRAAIRNIGLAAEPLGAGCLARFLACALLAIALGTGTARAHSASDAYLNLTLAAPVGSTVVVHGQWDIALRDLDFVLGLDANGDGRVTWGEVRRRQVDIERYAYAALHAANGAGRACLIQPSGQMIDEHADGAYAALLFDITCARAQASHQPPHPPALMLNYGLFFAIDPSHRGIVVMRSADGVATAVASAQNAVIQMVIPRR